MVSVCEELNRVCVCKKKSVAIHKALHALMEEGRPCLSTRVLQLIRSRYVVHDCNVIRDLLAERPTALCYCVRTGHTQQPTTDPSIVLVL